VGVFVAVGVAVEFVSSSGGSGKTAYSLGGPVSFSGSVLSFVVERAFRELLRNGGALKPEIVGPKLSDSGDRVELGVVVVGLVPARFLDVVSCGVCVVTMKGPLRRSDNEASPSPFSDGPDETGVLPRGAAGDGPAGSVVLTSVEPLPLRFRRRYASMALASCSRTRDAIGDSAEAGFETEDNSVLLEYEKPGVGEAENVLALPDEEAPERYVF